MDGDPESGIADTVAAGAVESEAPTMPAHAPAPGMRHASPLARYKLGSLLGRGGMGEVVSARDEQIGRSVAIKRMRGAASPDAIARFLREARIQGGLDHPAIVPVHELWQDDSGQPYFVMKQLAGVTLAHVIERLAANDAETVKAYSRQHLLRAFADVCLAVEFAHRRGVIHRDLKPSNIVLGEFGEVYVLDWGIARVVGDAAARADLDEPGALDTLQTVAGSVLGTPGYMSPEQVRGADDLDGRADVYALGCILFELLALAPAHPPGLMGIHAALHGKSPAPSSLAPDRDIPPELDAICTVALDGDRDKRFTTARALAEAVQRFLDGDRDLALRRDLARGELEAARTALARGNSPADREAALRAAARAIALDPTQREPAELVGRLMLEPPAETPREVEDVLYELDLDAFEEARPVLAFSGLTFMAFLPMLWLTGFHAPWFFGVAAVFATTIAVLAKLSPRARGVGGGRVILLAWAGLVVLLAIMMTPILAAPGVAAVVAMGVAAHPRVLSRWLLMALMVGAVLVPWLLAVVGVLPDTVTVDGNTIVLHAYTDALAPTPALVGLALFVVQMIVLAVLLANRQAVSRRAAQHAVELQAWQLRQLVSTASAEAPR